MRAEGTKFRTGVAVGQDVLASQLRDRYDAVVLAVGATKARDLPVPGRELDGVHQAMDYLPLSNKASEGDYVTPPINAKGKHVVIIGGGDTGADCLGTATRQGAASVTQLEIMPRPPEERPAGQPWPTYPMTYRVSSRARGEAASGSTRSAPTSSSATRTARSRALRLVEVSFGDGRFEPVPGTERETARRAGAARHGLHRARAGQRAGRPARPGPRRARQHRAATSEFRTNVPNVFAAGDAGRGQSLIVWAIAEGRSAAAAVDRYLGGQSDLAAPDRADDPAAARLSRTIDRRPRVQRDRVHRGGFR